MTNVFIYDIILMDGDYVDRDIKYIELLVNKCTNLVNNKVLFISYNKVIKNFIDKLVSYVRDMGVDDIYLEEEDSYYVHDFLINCSDEDMDSFFDKSVWDVYAEKGASFLIFETEIPHLMDDIDSKRIGYMGRVKRSTKPLYRKLQEECKLSWAIVAYPGDEWAKYLFDSDGAYARLSDYIFDMCLVNYDNPISEWDRVLDRNRRVIDKLNGLGLEKLHYSNSLGTDLDIYLPNDYLFSSASDNDIMVNMPSYEVFTSPIYNETEGVVYSSKPLVYNGSLIDDFYIKFSSGKVVSYGARVGYDILKEIIETDDYSCYLGEVALVEVDSPISRLGVNFGTTLIDENASCHLALGCAFCECIRDGIGKSWDDLRALGLNYSTQHVDFMIGTDDLDIVGYTHDNKVIKIMDKGVFSSDILV